MTKFEIEEKIVSMLKTVFDPEIPVNVYDLGLIYKIDVSDQGEASIDNGKLKTQKQQRRPLYSGPP